jgi:hypothetical protein
VQLLQNFINETKYTSNKGVDIILSYILQENKEKHPTMYQVAVQVLRNCSITLNFPIKILLRRGLLEDRIPMATRIGGREFEVMFELHYICPSFLLGVWNQLEAFMLDSLTVCTMWTVQRRRWPSISCYTCFLKMILTSHLNTDASESVLNIV